MNINDFITENYNYIKAIAINEYIMSTEDYNKYFSYEDFLYKNRNRINEIKKEITK